MGITYIIIFQQINSGSYGSIQIYQNRPSFEEGMTKTFLWTYGFTIHTVKLLKPICTPPAFLPHYHSRMCPSDRDVFEYLCLPYTDAGANTIKAPLLSAHVDVTDKFETLHIQFRHSMHLTSNAVCTSNSLCLLKTSAAATSGDPGRHLRGRLSTNAAT